MAVSSDFVDPVLHFSLSYIHVLRYLGEVAAKS